MISASKAGVKPAGNYAKPTAQAQAKARESQRRYHAMARSRTRYGRRFKLASRFVHDGDFVKLDCGCIARIVRRGAKNHTTRPVSVVDNEHCTLPPVDKDACYFIAADLDAAPLAGYRRFVPGGRRHPIGMQFEDGGLNSGVLLDPDALRAQWQEELDALEVKSRLDRSLDGDWCGTDPGPARPRRGLSTEAGGAEG